jgi:hypothetical protein
MSACADCCGACTGSPQREPTELISTGGENTGATLLQASHDGKEKAPADAEAPAVAIADVEVAVTAEPAPQTVGRAEPAVAYADLESGVPVAAAAAAGTAGPVVASPGWTEAQQQLLTTQTHPDAHRNIVSTLKTDNKALAALRILVIVLFVLPILLPVLLVQLPLILLLVPVWLFTPECLLWYLGIEEQSNHAPAFMRKEGTQVPAQLRGIFYMRNNPMDDDLVVFEPGMWDGEKKSLVLPVYLPRTWSFKRKLNSVVLLVLVRLLRYRYTFSFTTDASGRLSEAEIRLKIFCITVPGCLMRYGMTDVSANRDGSLWERWSILFGIPFRSYWVERVVDEQGSELPYFENVKKEVPVKCLCIKG